MTYHLNVNIFKMMIRPLQAVRDRARTNRHGDQLHSDLHRGSSSAWRARQGMRWCFNGTVLCSFSSPWNCSSCILPVACRKKGACGECCKIWIWSFPVLPPPSRPGDQLELVQTVSLDIFGLSSTKGATAAITKQHKLPSHHQVVTIEFAMFVRVPSNMLRTKCTHSNYSPSSLQQT